MRYIEYFNTYTETLQGPYGDLKQGPSTGTLQKRTQGDTDAGRLPIYISRNNSLSRNDSLYFVYLMDTSKHLSPGIVVLSLPSLWIFLSLSLFFLFLFFFSLFSLFLINSTLTIPRPVLSSETPLCIWLWIKYQDHLP